MDREAAALRGKRLMGSKKNNGIVPPEYSKLFDKYIQEVGESDSNLQETKVLSWLSKNGYRATDAHRIMESWRGMLSGD